MGNLAGAGVSGQLLHEVPILTTPLICGLVLEVKVFDDIVAGKLNSGLLITDRPLRPDRDVIPSGFTQIGNISGIILTGIVRLEDRFGSLVFNKAVGTFGFGHFGGRVIKDHIDNVNLASVQSRYRHGGRVATTLGSIGYRNDRIGVTVNG